MKQANKKQAILDVAVAIMSRKGKAATISEIANRAGVTDSVLYHYFQNKDDLLFHAAGAYLEGGITELRSHLEGIRDPFSRLSKFIWFQLYYHDTNPQYAYYTIFECRTKKAFFQHPAFGSFRTWTRILKSILRSGKKEGAFPPDLNETLVRDMILGLLDIENIQCFTGRNPQPAQKDIDIILDMLGPILTVDPPEAVDKPGRIMRTAERIFAEKGYDKATVAEIAAGADVAEGTIYDYFRNKEDLLYSMLQGRIAGHLETLPELFSPRDPVKKLQRFSRHLFSLFFRQPDFARTMILNGIFNQRFYASDAYHDFSQYLDTVDRIIHDGQAAGRIRAAIHPRVFRNLLMGVFSHMALRWMFVGRAAAGGESREINTAIDLLCRIAAEPLPAGR